MNKELLLEIKKHILEEPRRLDMHNWLQRYTKEDMEEDYYKTLPSCGTTACIAGWAVILANKDSKEPVSFSFDAALDALEISDDDARVVDSLFYLPSWPQQFRVEYDNYPPETDYKQRAEWRAKVTAERIQHFIDTRL